MTADTIDVAELRRVLMDQPEPWATRAVALVISIAFLMAVLNLVRRGRLREEYTPIWTIVAVGIMVLSVWSDALRALTHAVGAWAPSSTLFFFGELFLLVLCLNHAVRLSRLTLDVNSSRRSSRCSAPTSAIVNGAPAPDRAGARSRPADRPLSVRRRERYGVDRSAGGVRPLRRHHDHAPLPPAALLGLPL